MHGLTDSRTWRKLEITLAYAACMVLTLHHDKALHKRLDTLSAIFARGVVAHDLLPAELRFRLFPIRPDRSLNQGKFWRAPPSCIPQHLPLNGLEDQVL